MLLVLDQHRFDIAVHAVVVGLVPAGDPNVADTLVAQGAHVVAVPERGQVAAVCERVRVPVVVSASDHVTSVDGRRHPAVGPFADDPTGAAIGAETAALLGGARLVVTHDVGRTRRVAEVVARLLEARTSR